MPNTLVHLGVQGLVTRTFIREADLRWIFVGCVIPDAPWILQRVVRSVLPSLNPYDLRAFAVAQSSLVCCLLLSGALALLTAAPRRVFAILATGSLLHLILDALQTKWANGVHLFAPFSWELWNAGLFWPESLPTILLTTGGLAYSVWVLLRGPGIRVGWAVRPNARLAGAGALLVAWAALPIALLGGPERADNHFIATLRQREARAGRPVELDRGAYRRDPGGDVIRTWAGEDLRVAGGGTARPGKVSVRGYFGDEGTIAIRELHEHTGFSRDAATFVGLFAVAAVWLLPRRGARGR